MASVWHSPPACSVSGSPAWRTRSLMPNSRSWARSAGGSGVPAMIAPASIGGHGAMVVVSRTIMLRFGVNSPVDRLPSCGMAIHPCASGVTMISVAGWVPFT